MSQPSSDSKQPFHLVHQQEQFSGPIPHPSILQHYNQVVSGAAQRILSMAENQSAHRIALEPAVVLSDVKKSERGQWFGLVVALVGLLVALILGLTEHEIAASAIGGVTLVSLVAVFVVGRSEKKKEREEARRERSPS